MNLAVVILADPRNGEEALGRLFNGLALAHDNLLPGTGGLPSLSALLAENCSVVTF